MGEGSGGGIPHVNKFEQFMFLGWGHHNGSGRGASIIHVAGEGRELVTNQ